ncbi:MAG: xanthan lyase [Ignavibacteriales bacterium]|nr:xanthan lyase [Ignavibacteriales bacterium]
MKNLRIILAVISTFFFLKCSTTEEISLNDEFMQRTESFKQNIDSLNQIFNLQKNTKLENALIDTTNNIISLEFNRNFAVIPFREENVNEINKIVKDFFGERFENYNYKIFSMGYPVESLIPNYYKTDKTKIDSSKLPKQKTERIPVVQNSSKNLKSIRGLSGKNILLWHSHGWYYNNDEKRWMWQRARLFQTVEDVGPMAFTIPYLIPMLENAGANVFVPRERDIQLNEVIADNDFSNKESYQEKTFSEKSFWKTSPQKGFALKNKTIKEGENPFKQGTSRYTKSMINPLATASWLPEIPAAGEYAVYISYASSDSNVTDAHYKIFHSGGETEFLVNQTIGGNTWIYLGTYKFEKGNKKLQGVVLSNQSKDENKIVSADAVRFGGGMGMVEREGTISGRPKYVEGSRYWLQYAGMPDTLIYNLNNNSDDYKDDYQSRGEYGNFLFGAPFGPNKNRSEKGLGIPLDISLAFHTDAGITRNDTAIGTLMIYSIPGLDSQQVFPDGVSRLANRDLSDIVMTQLVDDIRVNYDSTWTRRQLMNALYSEAARPNFPSMLLELLSHQNFYEMKFELDPRFRFDVSRAIYKGMLKFLSAQYGYDFVVQPLPPNNFSTELNSNGELSLSWKAQIDTLESTAAADKFILYTRQDDAGFDNGKIVESNKIVLNDLKQGVIYSYKITAINNGGESFPTEILSVCWMKNSSAPILIVNGFDRVSAPASFDSPTFSGFTNFVDEGVPDKYDLGFTGTQFNFNPNSKWLTDDNPGHGASHSDYESKIIAGNTFDFTYVHGKAIKENGFSFCSASDESIIGGQVDLTRYKMVDFIFGEEKKTSAPKYKDKIDFEVFPETLREKTTNFLNNGGKIFLSGSYIGTDLYSEPDSIGIRFANEVLKFKLKTGHAVKIGNVFSVNNNFLTLKSMLEFNTSFNDSIYKVEAPDELGSVKGSEVLLRYSENNFSAAVGYKEKYGVVSLGFPFETIMGEKQRNMLMKSVLNYLDIK